MALARNRPRRAAPPRPSSAARRVPAISREIERGAALFDSAQLRARSPRSPARRRRVRRPSRRHDWRPGRRAPRPAPRAGRMRPHRGARGGRPRLRPGHGRPRLHQPPPPGRNPGDAAEGGPRDAPPAGRRPRRRIQLPEGRDRRDPVRRPASARADRLGPGHRARGRRRRSKSSISMPAAAQVPRRRAPGPPRRRHAWSCCTPRPRHARGSWRRPTGCSTASTLASDPDPAQARRRPARRGARGSRRRNARREGHQADAPAQAVSPLTRGSRSRRFP